MRYALNPKTGRLVSIHGATYQQLRKTNVLRATHPIYMVPKHKKPWKDRAPMTVTARRRLHSNCGACFLIQDPPAYPICIKGTHSCQPDCEGIMAAMKAAQRTKNSKIYQKSLKLLNQYCKE